MRIFKAMALAMGVIACACVKPAYSAATLSQDEFEKRVSAPAVSGVNGKLSVGYLGLEVDAVNNFGFNGTHDGWFGEGSLTVPLGERFGAQIDAMYGDLGGSIDLQYHGVGGHIFWRDPNQALLGLYSHYKNFDGNLEVFQIAAEGEIYRDRVSLEFLAGADRVNSVVEDKTYFAGEALVAYYPSDNFRVSAGIRRSFDTTSVIFGAETTVQIGNVSPTFFADAAIGNRFSSVSGGIRFYFGRDEKSLIRRHREDDPKIRLHDNAYAFARRNANAGNAGQDDGIDPIMTGSVSEDGEPEIPTTSPVNAPAKQTPTLPLANKPDPVPPLPEDELPVLELVFEEGNDFSSTEPVY